MTNSTKLVLVLEDEPVIALSLSRNIERLGHTVMGPFGTLEQAEAAVGDDVPQVAMLDGNLNNRTSYEFARVLRSKGTIVVFVTGGLVADVPEDLADCRIVMKPFGSPEIASLLLP